MKHIPLSAGDFAIVDDADYELLSGSKWSTSRSGKYKSAQRRALPGDGVKGSHITMPRFLLGFPRGYVDHKNGNPLDNRRANLRVCTPSQNAMNKNRPVHNKSGFKGVVWRKDRGHWSVGVRRGGRYIYVGSSSDKIAAARMYDHAAIANFGEYAKLNFPVG